MNKYETVIIMKNDIAEEEKEKTISEIEYYINSNGKITKIDDLGIKKMAYETRKYNQGHYYVIEFESEAKAICELERLYRIKDEILKFIVVRKDD